MRRKLVSALVALVVAAIGAGGAILAVVFRDTPPRRETPEAIRTVAVRRLAFEEATVRITGYGTLRARDRVEIAPEIAGRVVMVAPELEEGLSVAAGATLFAIDERPFALVRDSAQAQIQALDARLAQLAASRDADRARAEVLRASKDLADREFARARKLLVEDKVGSQAQVESAQRAALREHDFLLVVEKALALYDSQIAETRASARASLEQAALDLERTVVRAPVAGRMDLAAVEVGQIVSAGRVVVAIEAADTLEVSVPLEGKDLLWLPRDERFGTVRACPATVTWLQGGIAWPAVLSRLEKYDAATRSAVAVVALAPAGDRPAREGSIGTALAGGTPEAAPPIPPIRPLSGFFCRVDITGAQVPRVVRVPRELVRADGAVPILHEGKLVLRPVSVLRWQDGEALVDEGVAAGDLLVLSPLARALPGMELAGEPE
jgi:multidrug efflux pump subunit AcrA (membrane-fusion protein)